MRRARPKILNSLVVNALGPLEEEVMQAVCALGKCTVRDALKALTPGRFAYTTIMSTMSRLYEKGLLQRKIRGRAHVYRPALSMRQLEAQRGRDLIAAFLACGHSAPSQLTKDLVDALYAFSPSLPESIENEIHVRRKTQAGPERLIAHYQSWPAYGDVWPLGNA